VQPRACEGALCADPLADGGRNLAAVKLALESPATPERQAG